MVYKNPPKVTRWQIRHVRHDMGREKLICLQVHAREQGNEVVKEKLELVLA